MNIYRVGILVKLALAASVLWMSFAFEASAEGRCPPGQYPVGGQGVGGCAPIPGRGNAQPAQQQAPPPPPVWLQTRYGAIAMSPSTSAAGVAAEQTSSEAAAAVAMKDCQREGARDCAVISRYSNQCIALLVPGAWPAGAKGGIGTGVTPELARQDAQKHCIDPAGSGCTASYEACSFPER
ncbi:DUF4189 domain-containing protein [Stenotrophomonas chelatiphaga]|uniref:DUF4189 domain-containing protein n=1 Tax=Stenotrophomonas chelatiphaga TaxID=517011 RepID=UPI00289D6408|nr:DUF4189 domain-containing protein [Stenotrophomonas chelatiphaga]